MNRARYQLTIPGDFRRPLAAAWLFLAVAALLVSGLFVILIVASRTPGIQALFPLQNFFHLAIVAHVDFSVLIWFAAFGAALWTLASQPRAPLAAWCALGLVAAGSMLLALGPFRGGQAIMSNYVPVLDNRVFLAGLAIFAAGITLGALRNLFHPLPTGTATPEEGVLRFGIQTSAIALLLAAGAFVWSYLSLPEFLSGAHFYEVLFWGGGHVLQFAWVQLTLVAWLWLAGAGDIRVPLSPRLVLVLVLAGMVPVFLSLWGYLAFEVSGPDHRRFFVWLMAAGGGLAAGPLGLALLAGWWRSRPVTDPRLRGLRASLLFSIGLFGLGGMLGFLIDDSNTMVPAHYHGCIVAITLAFMALGLHLLPRLGFAEARPSLVLALPWVYGTGQLLHVIGLAFAGGHGVQRKTAGADQALENLAQIVGMGVMGIGGLIAIIGGMLFLAGFGRAVMGRRVPLAAPAT